MLLHFNTLFFSIPWLSVKSNFLSQGSSGLQYCYSITLRYHGQISEKTEVRFRPYVKQELCCTTMKQNNLTHNFQCSTPWQIYRQIF